MDVQVLNTIAMEATIMDAAHTQEATAIFNLNVKALLGHHASKVYVSAISVTPLFKSLYEQLCTTPRNAQYSYVFF